MGYKCLVLLIGTNPLPNYVVGSYLKDKYNKFIFIYSKEDEKINQSSTSEYAEKLKKHLYLNNNDCSLLPLSDISNPNSIKDDLKNKFPKGNIDEVHLNYTGGTKTMVAHVYNFLKEKFGDKFNASYLDARTYKLIYDNIEEDISLKDKVKIDINTLLSIHLYDKNVSFEIYDTYSYKSKFKNGFDEISQEIEKAVKDGKSEEFIKWLEDPFRKIFKGPDKILENKGKFKQHIDNLSKNNDLSPINKFNDNTPDFIWDILNAFPEDKRINDEQKLWIPDDSITNNKAFSERIKDTVEFLDGKWFEWYIYNEIRNELLNRGLKEEEHLGISLKAQKGNSPNFELDIFIINGYQLVGLSLTTSKRQRDCKLKGFEVIHRVRQIGGDESKAILITGLKKEYKDDSNRGTKKLQEDLSFVTGTAEDKIIVFGIDDWADIGDKICKEVFR
ncbi:hypothetical protein Thena_0824 [Thermodesulfobium narugense DSM 14796]|uniref:Card1 CARF domain-containing protein n=1 Tax=Thermodesulfobium narugense DSM 14796 TaxID=747365 RepID=M1E5S3_9BACT|nr:DUF1887 family protein [Thermodesulfobium narugense]AEE14456.1 hypothetical protein Thena_0824 [Thermodesulfobium narugense DSM 14796]